MTVADMTTCPTPHLVLHQPRQWQVVKQVCEAPPDLCVAVLAQALVIEAIPENSGAAGRHSVQPAMLLQRLPSPTTSLCGLHAIRHS
jgi:hypothetical protein